MTTQERQTVVDARRKQGGKRESDWQESGSLGDWNRPEQFHLRKRERPSVPQRMFPFTFLKMPEATGADGRTGMCGADPKSHGQFQRVNQMTVAFPARRKRAFITGITGQDGSYLAELLKSKSYEVHGIKRRSSSFHTERVDHLISDWHERDISFFLHFADLSDATSLSKLL